ncbi:MAG: tryptophan--tRNA ligase [Candidatus Neomarinimicrobiota bacterium]|nr:tryptophan--tRNA ligase [Candidatus Neomarinimicrobiota bacterium]
MPKKKNLRVLSGIQPSGSLHLGNYFGMMSRMIKYQEENELFCFIANYHALTTIPNSTTLSENTFNAACDFLALGLDPEKSTFWVQSDIPEVTELTWIISSQASVGLMERATSYKDKIARGHKPNMGLYSYPILMAADILLYDSQVVPVGIDQKQHLEMTRDIAIRFNNTFGETFVVPEPDIEKWSQLVPGIDGQKMSKSYNNTIPIFDPEKKVRKTIMRIVTDTTPVDDPKDKNTPLFNLFSLFLDKNEQKDLADRYDGSGLRYGDVKQELFEKVMNHFQPYREKRAQLSSNPKKVHDILKFGSEKAHRIAEDVMERVKSATGVIYR